MSEAQWNLEGQENKEAQVEIPEILPLLPIRDIVIYPYMMLPLFVGRDVSIRAVEEALSRDRLIFFGFADEFFRGESGSRRYSPRGYDRIDHAHAEVRGRRRQDSGPGFGQGRSGHLLAREAIL